jgi:hypothetical protein
MATDNSMTGAAGAGQKKRRARKKAKLNDTDIMNNFMKNLQKSHEEVK